MEWSDSAIILQAARHGESHAVIDVLAAEHGRWRGLVRGGGGRRMAAIVQPGNEVRVAWRGRLESHLGSFTLEPVRDRAAAIMGDATRLAGLASICATLVICLPEREPHPAIHEALLAGLDLLGDRRNSLVEWGSALVRLELGLLGELGYGLDLGSCAVTGSRETLVWVSPRTGRAVSAAAGAPWAGRLLALPAFLTVPDRSAATTAEVLAGLLLTGYFLDCHATAPHGKTLPPARGRLCERIASLSS